MSDKTQLDWNFPNFSFMELLKSQTAIRLKIDNFPPAEHEENLHKLVKEFLQPLRTKLNMPLVINSGYRCPDLNAAIGSKPSSHHTRGMAVDIECPGVSTAELCLFIAESGLSYTQMILEYFTPAISDSGWVHVGVDTNNPKKELLLKERHAPYRQLPIGELKSLCKKTVN